MNVKRIHHMFFSYMAVSSRLSSFHQHLAYSFVVILTSDESYDLRKWNFHTYGRPEMIDFKNIIRVTLPALPRIDTAEHDLGFKQFFCCFLQLKEILTVVQPQLRDQLSKS